MRSGMNFSIGMQNLLYVSTVMISLAEKSCQKAEILCAGKDMINSDCSFMPVLVSLI